MTGTHHALLVAQESVLAGGVIPFQLENGHAGVIAAEERRTYDHIVHSNCGSIVATGLTGQQY